VPLSAAFLRLYGDAAAGRTVSARLSHDRRGNGSCDGSRDWPLRAADFDTAGHVNNAIHWAAVEDVLAAYSTPGWLPSVAEMEYHRAIGPGCTPRLTVAEREHDTQVWMLDGERLLASARLTR
jgi:acyl-ACP thioesterase